MQPTENFSVPRRALDVEDFIDILRRHKGWIFGPFLLTLVASVVGVYLWPDSYESVAVVKIVPQQVPQNMVQSSITNDLADRINSMATTVLSRNVLTTIINNFEGYDKHYFLGGNAEFNNFGGLLKNIEDLQMHTEGSFQSPRINVWGISDKDLFLEANKVFRHKQKPFFAIIQTSNNHRPFMIPPRDTADFKIKSETPERLLKYGFGSIEEYNSFRYSDYCFKEFMEAAEKEDYFHNTIFVFVGDHGVAGNAEAVYPSAWTKERLTDEHVPLLFYAPYLLKPQKRSEVVSQIDVLPTVAGMIQQPYVNTTLGRDLLDTTKKNNFAFITNTAGKIGIVTDDFYFTTNLNFPDEHMVAVREKGSQYNKAQRDSIQKRLSVFTTAFFETAKYMLMNNHRE